MTDPSIDDLFQQAVELPGEKLDGILSSLAEPVREQLLTLLKADASAVEGGFLDKFQADGDAQSATDPTIVPGNHKCLSEHLANTALEPGAELLFPSRSNGESTFAVASAHIPRGPTRIMAKKRSDISLLKRTRSSKSSRSSD